MLYKFRNLKLKNIIVVFVSAVLFFGSTFFLRAAFKIYLKKAYPTGYSEYVLKYSAEYGFEPSLIYAIIHTESGFKNNAVSSANAKGLMQITDETYDWARYREKSEDTVKGDLFDPETNIKYGVMILSLLRESYQNEDTYLAAYNAGFGSVRDWLADEKYSQDGTKLHSIPFPETENYVVKVKNAKKIYDELYNK